uniref:Wall-associated receptor kinase galacturonan-binding domain-containing protein n=1 Tax=Salix viminalis TaxID=40686 RepID=A0A6N2MF62_SALVM
MFISRISRHPFGAYAALLLLEILSTHHRCSARKSSNDCAPSSCGNFLNISSPFRLNTDPGSCGDGIVELGCEDNVRLTFHLNMVKYYVKAINYSDSTFRLVDPVVQKDDCFSLPHHYLTEAVSSFAYFNDNNNNYYYDYKYGGESSVLAFICCENEIQNQTDYIMDTSSCKNGSGTAHNSSPSCVDMEGHSYVMVDGDNKDVPDLCRVNLMYPVPKNVTNMSYKDVHDILADGFELQW